MTATLRKPGTWVLAIVLVGFTQAGVRCGDTTFPHGRISHQVVIDR
ncbi:MAG TPA: hypothetical protein VLL08_04225 [Kineosporiaceae bacterium]|nr:hypothetical protein [Kineosporiaceae bacterium]